MSILKLEKKYSVWISRPETLLEDNVEMSKRASDDEYNNTESPILLFTEKKVGKMEMRKIAVIETVLSPL